MIYSKFLYSIKLLLLLSLSLSCMRVYVFVLTDNNRVLWIKFSRLGQKRRYNNFF
jgi:hypothetical protein